MDQTQALRLQCLQAAQRLDPEGDVFATAGKYAEWIGSDQVRHQAFLMASASAKPGEDALAQAKKIADWVGASQPAPNSPQQHESVKAVKGQEPRA